MHVAGEAVSSIAQQLGSRDRGADAGPEPIAERHQSLVLADAFGLGIFEGDSQRRGAGDVLRARAQSALLTAAVQERRDAGVTRHDDGARADSVPNLEILTGNVVSAGHASATGRFDEEQLFYLMSRGITSDEARRLVVLGFFADVLDGIGVPMIRSELMRAVEAELGYAQEAP